MGRLVAGHSPRVATTEGTDQTLQRQFGGADDRERLVARGCNFRVVASGQPNVSFEVVHGNAFSIPCDVLALKWAQQGYGVDAAAVSELVADRMIRNESELPRPWGFKHFARKGEPGPTRFLFVGVPPLRQFGYPEIRRFAAEVLGSLAGELPNTRRLALTLHGPGFGLDELACFEAEVNGLLDSIRSRHVPRDLRQIVFVEANRGRAGRLDNYLRDYLGPVAAPSAGLVSPSVAEDLNSRRGAPGQSVSERPTAFVAMPFADEFDDTYNLGLQPSLHDQGYKCERMDQAHFVGDVVAEMRKRVRGAALVVADLTGANPNVYLEVGFAWAVEIPTILVARKSDDLTASLRFDVQGQRCLVYRNITELKRLLEAEVAGLRRPT